MIFRKGGVLWLLIFRRVYKNYIMFFLIKWVNYMFKIKIQMQTEIKITEKQERT